MYYKVMTIVLWLFLPLTIVSMVEAQDFALHTDAHPWPEADAKKETDKLVSALGNKVNLEVFGPDDRDALANWVKAHIDSGGSTLILTGITPSSIYPKGNTEPDGSILEAFLDAGNTIFNTGEYTFYTAEGPEETNETQGLHNIIDVPNAFVWHVKGDDGWKEEPVVMRPTEDGRKYTPSIKEYGTSYPLHIEDYEGTSWQLEIALAENTDEDLRVDPAMIINQETGGRLGVFVQAYVGDVPNPDVSFGDLISEFILNYYVPKVLTAVEPDSKLALTWGQIKSNR